MILLVSSFFTKCTHVFLFLNNNNLLQSMLFNAISRCIILTSINIFIIYHVSNHIKEITLQEKILTRFSLLIIPSIGKNTKIVCIVHSALNHQEKRTIIRKTWSQASKDLSNLQIIFVVGTSTVKSDVKGIYLEADEYKDILMGDFIDSYRNLSYKNILGNKK